MTGGAIVEQDLRNSTASTSLAAHRGRHPIRSGMMIAQLGADDTSDIGLIHRKAFR